LALSPAAGKLFVVVIVVAILFIVDVVRAGGRRRQPPNHNLPFRRTSGKKITSGSRKGKSKDSPSTTMVVTRRCCCCFSIDQRRTTNFVVVVGGVVAQVMFPLIGIRQQARVLRAVHQEPRHTIALRGGVEGCRCHTIAIRTLLYCAFDRPASPVLSAPLKVDLLPWCKTKSRGSKLGEEDSACPRKRSSTRG